MNIARELLEAWSKAISAKDLLAASELWTDDAIFAGGSEGEIAVGPKLRLYLAAVLQSEHTLGWDWEEPLVRVHGDVAWFCAEATLHQEGTKPRPYRASGVLRQVDGQWRFAMWTGAEPV